MTSRPVSLLLAASSAVFCCCLASCKSTSANNNIVDYTGIPKEEYAFDEKGNYREDWVSGTSSSSAAKPDASTVPTVPTVVAANTYTTSDATSGTALATNVNYSPYVQDDTPEPEPMKEKPASSSSSSKKKTSTASTRSTPKSKPKVIAKKTTKKPAPKLYKIAKGDTLSAISRKTGRSVASLKAGNRMKSDFLREGWVIRIPAKK